MNMKSVFKRVAPPVLVDVLRFCLHRFRPLAKGRSQELFDGDGDLFVAAAKGAAHYGEYGVGASTLWVFRNTGMSVTAVDTSRSWVEKVNSEIDDLARANLKWVDLGPVGDWGRPLSYSRIDQVEDYLGYIWSNGKKPDLVLVDGRFRVACFLTSILKALPGTKIVFDDYSDRPHYHIVETIVPALARGRRQALFVVPEHFDREKAKHLLDRFAYVMD